MNYGRSHRFRGAADLFRMKGETWPGTCGSHADWSRDENWNRKPRMKDFSNASFSPDVIRAMDEALKAAVATLPHPVSSTRVQTIAESILRGAQEGERDARTLQTMALLEMQLRTEDQMN